MFSATCEPFKTDLPPKTSQFLTAHCCWNRQFLNCSSPRFWNVLNVDIHGREDPRVTHLSLDVLHIGALAFQPGTVRSSQTTPGPTLRAAGLMNRKECCYLALAHRPLRIENEIVWTVGFHGLVLPHCFIPTCLLPLSCPPCPACSQMPAALLALQTIGVEPQQIRRPTHEATVLTGPGRNGRNRSAAGAGYSVADCNCSGATTSPLRISRVALMNVIRLHTCKRCGKTWFPRSPGRPNICPTCKTTHWDTARTKRVSAK